MFYATPNRYGNRRGSAGARARDFGARERLHRRALDRFRRARRAAVTRHRRRRQGRYSVAQSRRGTPGFRASVRRGGADRRGPRRGHGPLARRRGGGARRWVPRGDGGRRRSRSRRARGARQDDRASARPHRRAARGARTSARLPPAAARAAALRHRRERQYLRRPHRGDRRRGSGRADHRRHSLDGPIATRLRALRRYDRRLRRHVRDAREFPHHARGARYGFGATRPLRDAHELREWPLHAGDRDDGRARTARYAAQRFDVRHSVSRHQHEADVRRSAFLTYA
jgi:hypothetical protein